jgi:hypothetical protein
MRLQTYRERLKSDHSLKERSKAYREERITALLKSWTDLAQADVAPASPSAFNNTVGTFKLILAIAYDNPAVHINRKKIAPKPMPPSLNGAKSFTTARGP